METATHHVIDPRGDILLVFPGRPLHHHEEDTAMAQTSNDEQQQLTPVAEFFSPATVYSIPTTHEPHHHHPSISDSPSGPTPKITLRVSSSVLSLASPVFAAMLSGPLSEGIAFRAPNSPRPFPVTLPEDDGAVFTILTNVIHFRSESVPVLPSTSTLLSLATLVDKYACHSALLCYGEIWLNRAIEASQLQSQQSQSRQSQPQSHQRTQSRNNSISTNSTLQNPGSSGSKYNNEEDLTTLESQTALLLFAYALDLPSPFFHLSREVILSHRQQLKAETEFGLDLPLLTLNHQHERQENQYDHLLRHDLHTELARKKARFRRELHEAIMEPVSRVTYVLSLSSSPTSNPIPEGGDATVPTQRKPTCPNAAAAMGNYMAFLDFHNLSPWRAQYETDSFSSIIKRALEAAQQASDKPMLKFEACSRARCSCGGMAYGDSVHMARQLAWSLGGALKWKLGACLDCLKNGKDYGGKCRVEHS